MKNETQVQLVGIGLLLLMIWINTLFLALDIEMFIATIVSTVITAIFSILIIILPHILVE